MNGEGPERCSVCRKPLRRLKHPVGHGGAVVWDSEIRTCPHNLYAHHFDEPRHDEWHLCDQGWVRREE